MFLRLNLYGEFTWGVERAQAAAARERTNEQVNLHVALLESHYIMNIVLHK